MNAQSKRVEKLAHLLFMCYILCFHQHLHPAYLNCLFLSLFLCVSQCELECINLYISMNFRLLDSLAETQLNFSYNVLTLVSKA